MPRPGPKKNHGRTRRRNHHPDRNRLRQNLSRHAAAGRTGARICGRTQNVRLPPVLWSVRRGKSGPDSDRCGSGFLHLPIAGHKRTDRPTPPGQPKILDYRHHRHSHVPAHCRIPDDSGKIRNNSSVAQA